MNEQRTVPSRRACLPIKAVRLEVVSGPDKGLRFDAKGENVTVGTASSNDLVLSDPKVSRFHLEIERRSDRILVCDHGSTNGTRIASVLLQDQSAWITVGTDIDIGDTRLELRDGEVVLLDLRGSESLGEIKGRTPVMKRLMAKVQKLALSDVPVLLLGESGTGKELVARALHELGDRSKGPFVTVDCGAISPEIFASELFGHERGAFTGAERKHLGAFERANGGTLFLDEIGELPPSLQVGLLGALERRRFRRVGGKDEIPVDVRIVSATNRDLRLEVNAGSFRFDLYYRVAVTLLTVPSLRERLDDIPLLIEHFAREAGHEGPIEQLFSEQSLEALSKHFWPGNVRELRNLVEASLALGETMQPSIGPIPQSSGEAAGSDPIEQVLELRYQDARRALLDQFEVRYLKNILERSGGSVRRAAKEARMDRSYLIELLKRHGLS